LSGFGDLVYKLTEGSCYVDAITELKILVRA